VETVGRLCSTYILSSRLIDYVAWFVVPSATHGGSTHSSPPTHYIPAPTVHFHGVTPLCLRILTWCPPFYATWDCGITPVLLVAMPHLRIPTYTLHTQLRTPTATCHVTSALPPRHAAHVPSAGQKAILPEPLAISGLPTTTFFFFFFFFSIRIPSITSTCYASCIISSSLSRLRDCRRATTAHYPYLKTCAL